MEEELPRRRSRGSIPAELEEGSCALGAGGAELVELCVCDVADGAVDAVAGDCDGFADLGHL